jgi:hypothetical protein
MRIPEREALIDRLKGSISSHSNSLIRPDAIDRAEAVLQAIVDDAHDGFPAVHEERLGTPCASISFVRSTEWV